MSGMALNGMLSVATWNLDGGGIDGADDSRLQGILERLKRTGPHDVVVMPEGKWRHDGSRRTHQIARYLGMPGGGYLARAPLYGCDIAVFVRETSTLHVVQERHESGTGVWFHALARLELELDTTTGPRRIDLCGIHLAPSLPSARALEAEMFHLIGKVPCIAAGDFNARAVAEPDLPPGLETTHKNERKLDVTPARTIQNAGFVDLGELADDLTPTVGTGANTGRVVPHRADRIITNINGVEVLEHAVIPADNGHSRPLSDHDGVTALIRIPT